MNKQGSTHAGGFPYGSQGFERDAGPGLRRPGAGAAGPEPAPAPGPGWVLGALAMNLNGTPPLFSGWRTIPT